MFDPVVFVVVFVSLLLILLVIYWLMYVGVAMIFFISESLSQIWKESFSTRRSKIIGAVTISIISVVAYIAATS